MRTTLSKLNYPLVINVVLALTLVANLLMLPIFVGLDYDISGVESNVVFTLQSILSDNSTLYDNPEQAPFTVTQYAPLYYLIADAVLTVMNVDPTNDLLIRVIGRSISVGLCLILVMVLFNTARKYMKLTAGQAIVLGVVLVAFTVPWYYLTRPDVLVALCYLIFIRLAYRYIDKGGFLPAFLMGFVAILAFASKQNGMFLTGMGGLFFLYYRDFKGLFFGLLGFVASATLFISIYHWSGYEGEFFLANAFDGVNNGLGVRSFIDHTILAYLSLFGFYTAGTLYVVYVLLMQKGKMDRKLFFTLGFAVLLFLFATATAVKKGSSVNYYNEFLMVTLLLWAFYFQTVNLSGLPGKSAMRAVLFLILAAFFASTSQLHTYFFTNLKQWMSDDQLLAEVTEVVESEIGDDYFYSSVRQLSLEFPGKVVLPQFDIAECCAYPRGIYSYDEFCQMMNNGKVKFLIFDSQAPESLYGCDVAANFDEYKAVGRYHIYKNVNGQAATVGLVE